MVKAQYFSQCSALEANDTELKKTQKKHLCLGTMATRPPHTIFLNANIVPKCIASCILLKTMASSTLLSVTP